MRFRNLHWRLACSLAVAVVIYAAPRPFRVYPSHELHDEVPLPPDFEEKTELVLGRLMYAPHPHAPFPIGRRRGPGAWLMGATSWTVDYPRGDRHFAQVLRRLTRIHVRSVEQPINLDDGDDVFHWPWLYVNLPGNWKLTDEQAKKLREYLLRGGFLMVDNFFGTPEWEIFIESFRRVFPDREIEDLDDNDQIFHTVYGLAERRQIPGWWALRSGRMYRFDGAVAHWRGVRDDHNRLMVAISFNSDIGDSWEWADDPRYPEHYSALGLRLGVNYAVYAMTH
jgi:hypothetical protein